MNIKKILISLCAGILLILAAALCACGDKNDGTYYPPFEEMKTNLESKGYTVVLDGDLSDDDANKRGGTMLSALKTDEYLFFYRLDNAADCDYFYNVLEEECADYNSLVKIANDEKYGNIVYCGTADAVDAAGIKVVNVKV